MEQAIVALSRELGGQDGTLEIWRLDADAAVAAPAAERQGTGTARGPRQARLLDEIEQRVGTAPLFGGGTLVVVRQPASL